MRGLALLGVPGAASWRKGSLGRRAAQAQSSVVLRGERNSAKAKRLEGRQRLCGLPKSPH